MGAVAAVTLLGLVLRLYSLDYGLPYQYVPDESTMVGGALSMGSNRSLQPSTFIYPAMLMYLFAGEYAGLLVVGRLTGMFSSMEQFKEYAFVDPTLFYLLPRISIALMGAATVPLVYLLARRLYGQWAGIAASGLLAASLMHVQQSHQARHWVPVSLLAVLVLWKSLDLLERGRRRDYWITGALVGLAAATSFNGFLLFALPAVAHLARQRREGRPLLDISFHPRLVMAGLLALGLFFALNPYILLQFDRFVAFHSAGESSIGGQILGHYDSDPRQFLEKQAFTFYGWTALSYDPAITLLGIAGAVVAARRYGATAALVISYPLFHFAMFATTAPSMEQRYILPAIVLWAVPAGLAAATAGEWVASRLGGSQVARGTVALLAVAMLGLASLPALRYDAILARVDTRTLAKAWIERDVPAGSEVVVESYAPPLTPSMETLRAQQRENPRSLGNRDQWLLDEGLPEGEPAYDLVRLNLVDTSPRVDSVTPYLAAHQNRYFVVSDFQWKSDHQGHMALKDYLARNGRLMGRISPSNHPGYVPSDLLNNMEDPLVELWMVERSGPVVEIYEVAR